MKQALKKSIKSSNFLTDVATIVSILLIAILNTNFDTLDISELNLSELLIPAIIKFANVAYHMNKDKNTVVAN